MDYNGQSTEAKELLRLQGVVNGTQKCADRAVQLFVPGVLQGPLDYVSGALGYFLGPPAGLLLRWTDAGVDLFLDLISIVTEMVYEGLTIAYEGLTPRFLQSWLLEFSRARQIFMERLRSNASDGDESESSSYITALQKPINGFITAGRAAYAAVALRDEPKKPVVKLFVNVKERKPKKAKSIVPDKQPDGDINIDGLWRLDKEKSEPWDALFDILGIPYKKTSGRSMSSSAQEFHHEGTQISHQIFGVLGGAPTVFTIGADPVEEEGADGPIITRYFLDNNGEALVQESVNPKKGVTVVTTRTLEDEGQTLVQVSVATKDDRSGSVRRVFKKDDNIPWNMETDDEEEGYE